MSSTTLKVVAGDEPRHCLHWNNFESQIAAQFRVLRENEELTDVTIACDGQFVHAHKLILAACSPLFRDLFKRNPTSHSTLFMQDTESRILEAIIEFIYTGEVRMHHAELQKFMRTAKSFQIRSLENFQLPDPLINILESQNCNLQAKNECADKPKKVDSNIPINSNHMDWELAIHQESEHNLRENLVESQNCPIIGEIEPENVSEMDKECEAPIFQSDDKVAEKLQETDNSQQDDASKHSNDDKINEKLFQIATVALHKNTVSSRKTGNQQEVEDNSLENSQSEFQDVSKMDKKKLQKMDNYQQVDASKHSKVDKLFQKVKLYKYTWEPVNQQAFQENSRENVVENENFQSINETESQDVSKMDKKCKSPINESDDKLAEISQETESSQQIDASKHAENMEEFLKMPSVEIAPTLYMEWEPGTNELLEDDSRVKLVELLNSQVNQAIQELQALPKVDQKFESENNQSDDNSNEKSEKIENTQKVDVSKHSKDAQIMKNSYNMTTNEINENIAPKASESTSIKATLSSNTRFIKDYFKFCDWRTSKNIKGVDEEIMISYVCEKYKQSTAKSFAMHFTRLQRLLKEMEKIDIQQFSKANELLKKLKKDENAIKSNALSRANLIKFIETAPDKEFLLMKIVAILGLSGACRCGEMIQLTMDHVKEENGYISVRVPSLHAKTRKTRSFQISSEEFGVNAIELFRKFINLRPKHVSHDYLFIDYSMGKCSAKRVDTKSFYRYPKLIAMFLKLDNPASYTGQCFSKS